MNNDKLKEGINLLFDLQYNNAVIESSIRSLKGQTSKLGLKKNIRKPVKEQKETSLLTHFFIWAITLAILGVVIGIIVGIVKSNGFFDAIGEAIEYGFNYGLIGIGASVIVSIVSYIITSVRESNRIKNKYNQDNVKYENMLTTDKNRVQKELRQKRQLYQQLEILDERYKSNRNLCSNIYRNMGLDSDYYNFKAICYMKEFINLGITDHLEGVDGLYYLVRNELRMEKLQNSVDAISQKLDYIINGQERFEFYLENIEAQCNRMVNSTVKLIEQNNEIVNNTAITAYNTERIAKENECMLFLQALRYYS